MVKVAIIKKTMNKMVGIFCADDGEPLNGDDKKNEEDTILQRDYIRRIREAVRLKKIALNNQSWFENWQADLLRKSKVLKKVEWNLVLKLILDG